MQYLKRAQTGSASSLKFSLRWASNLATTTTAVFALGSASAS